MRSGRRKAKTCGAVRVRAGAGADGVRFVGRDHVQVRCFRHDVGQHGRPLDAVGGRSDFVRLSESPAANLPTLTTVFEGQFRNRLQGNFAGAKESLARRRRGGGIGLQSAAGGEPEFLGAAPTAQRVGLFEGDALAGVAADQKRQRVTSHLQRVRPDLQGRPHDDLSDWVGDSSDAVVERDGVGSRVFGAHGVDVPLIGGRAGQIDPIAGPRVERLGVDPGERGRGEVQALTERELEGQRGAGRRWGRRTGGDFEFDQAAQFVRAAEGEPVEVEGLDAGDHELSIVQAGQRGLAVETVVHGGDGGDVAADDANDQRSVGGGADGQPAGAVGDLTAMILFPELRGIGAGVDELLDGCAGGDEQGGGAAAVARESVQRRAAGVAQERFGFVVGVDVRLGAEFHDGFVARDGLAAAANERDVGADLARLEGAEDQRSSTGAGEWGPIEPPGDFLRVLREHA